LIFFIKDPIHLYGVIGNPGIIKVYAARTHPHTGTIPAEGGANAIAFDKSRNKADAFLPQPHKHTVFINQIWSKLIESKYLFQEVAWILRPKNNG